MFIAHVSDTHLDRGERARDRTRRVLAYLDGLSTPPDAVILTGDIADHGSVEEYEEAAALLASSPHRILHCPGNHDRRDAYRKVLGGPEGELNTVHLVAGHAVILCDSLIEGVDEGALSPATLDWLAATLTEHRDRPTLVGFHHPPVRMHQRRVDQWMLTDPDALAAVLADHDQVLAVLTGHTHTAAASTFAGRPLLIAPGVVSTLRLDWEPGDAIIDLDAPPGVAFHVTDDAGRVMTHFRTV